MVFIALIASCAGYRYHQEGMNQLAEGNIEAGLANLEQAANEEPDNVRYRTDLLMRRAEQVNKLLSTGDAERIAGKLDAAEAAYKSALKIEPGNSRALSGVDAVNRDRRHAPLIEQAKEALKKGDAHHAYLLIKPVLIENPSNKEAASLKYKIEEQTTREQVTEPTLGNRQKKPISMDFREANVKVVLEALARSTGVNFIIDKDVRPDMRVTVFLRQASLEDAIDLILQTSRLEKKVLNRNTVLIYPNTPEKLKEYQELIVKGFYLANADVKQTQAMLKSMLKTKDTFVDEKLNLLVMRDTPDAIKLAEKLIAMHDIYEPEVMLEVEVLEVRRTRLTELGIKWPAQIALTPLGTSNTLTISDLKNLNSDRIAVNIPSTIVNLRREVGDVNILANPRIRARNREKAKIMIGEKVPVSTSTTTATGIITESIQYLDVGIKLDVEPNVYLQDDIAIKIGLEVSSITNQVITPAGSLAYQIGSRSASTVLRLKDGETQVLAGLINDEDRSAASRVPGLGDVPILNRIFGSQKDERLKTEIVLSITPRLIRNINRPDASTSEFWSGTEAGLRTRPLTLAMVGTDAAKSDAGMGDKNGGEDSAKTPPTAISLTWQGPKQTKVGEQFKLALRMKADGGVRSLPFQIGFDPSVLQVLEVSEGGYFKKNDAKTSMSSNIDANAGKVFVSIVRSGVDGAKGEDDVAVLTMRALAAKPTEVKLLSASPIVLGEKTINPVPPAPFAINITN